MNTFQTHQLSEGIAMIIMLVGGMGLFCLVTKSRIRK